MADTHAVVRTDKLAGTDVRSKLCSFKYMGIGTTATDIDNGNVVNITGGLIDDEREVYKAVTPAKTDVLGDLALVASPEMIYDAAKQDIRNFYNEAGEIARGYILTSGDIFSVTAEALSGADSTTTVGAIVEMDAATKLKVVTTATSGSTTIGKIIAVETVGVLKYFVIQVD